MPETIVLSLISHTNAGKTTLLRTLLRQDVGEVADRAHVTVQEESHRLAATEDGEAVLEIWDTPGFGSNLAKLSRRLRGQSNPLGWLLHQVWDRARDASLYYSQAALLSARRHADLILYIIDMSQNPVQSGYVDAELEVLGLLGKPVVVVLNQTGPPDPEADRAREESVRVLLERHPAARRVIGLDAFTRCWVQEIELLDLVAGLVDPARGPAARRLAEEWTRRQIAVLDEAGDLLAGLFAGAAADSEAFSQPSALGRVRQMLSKEQRHGEFSRLERALEERQRQRTEETVNRLIALHGIEGATARKFAGAAREHFSAAGGKVDEILTSIGGGVVSGLLGGVVLDIASSGISFGSGAVAGALLGGFTSYALARGYNLTQGDSQTVRWTEARFRDQVRFALLLYLAAAHFGRGRGRWRDAPENPASWILAVDRAVTRHEADLLAFWKRGKGGDPDALRASHRGLVSALLRETLADLYPEARRLFS